MKNHFIILLLLMSYSSGTYINKQEKSKNLISTEIIVSRAQYQDQLYGFWLGECIANWTGLITEMDKIGNIGAIRTGDFYTRNNCGKADQASIWAEGIPSDLSPTIDFVFKNEGEIWGADDDTDIEYIASNLYKKMKFPNSHLMLKYSYYQLINQCVKKITDLFV